MRGHRLSRAVVAAGVLLWVATIAILDAPLAVWAAVALLAWVAVPLGMMADRATTGTPVPLAWIAVGFVPYLATLPACAYLGRFWNSAPTGGEA